MPGVLALALLVRPVLALEPDAWSVARGGAAVIERLEASPAAPLAAVPAGGLLLGADVRRIDAAAAIDAAAVRIAAARGRLALAATCDRVQSPVHHDLGATLATRWQEGAVAIGLAVEVRRLQFGPDLSLARLRARAGVGLRQGSGGAAAVVFEARSAGEAARMKAAGRVVPLAGIAIETEIEREPGAPANLRFALALGTAAARLGLGYETATAAAAAGAGIEVGRVRVAVALRVHPDLGWSPVWTCEWRP